MCDGVVQLLIICHEKTSVEFFLEISYDWLNYSWKFGNSRLTIRESVWWVAQIYRIFDAKFNAVFIWLTDDV